MIHVTYGSQHINRLSLLESKINTGVPDSRLRWLFKFTNDMLGTVKYTYGVVSVLNDRYVANRIAHGGDNVYTSTLDFKPFGYWKYEVYEVSWNDNVIIDEDHAPANERTVLIPASNSKGVVMGKVHEGKFYVTETDGQEQVQYTEHTESTTNYLYTNN